VEQEARVAAQDRERLGLDDPDGDVLDRYSSDEADYYRVTLMLIPVSALEPCETYVVF